MEHKQTISTRKIVFTALMAALTVAGSALRITLPVDIAGTTSFHLGNIMCALSGILLGPWLGGLAAGLGSLLYDVIFYPAYISECWITFLTKGAYALAAGLIICIGNKDALYYCFPKKDGVVAKTRIAAEEIYKIKSAEARRPREKANS